MKKIIFLLFVLCSVFELHIVAQNSFSEQVLVFRSSGEINLFYTDKLDSIGFSKYDKDSVLQENVVSQVFYSPDTTLVVPISEIDSVAFGSRNELQFKKDVHQMGVEDSLWIVSFDGERIIYKKNTPFSVLPKIGEKLFYGNLDDLFPFGLAAKVENIEKSKDCIVVVVRSVEFKDIFNKAFYAGTLVSSAPTTRLSKVKKGFSLHDIVERNFNIENEDLSASLGISYEYELVGNVVAAPLRGFYSLSCDFEGILSSSLSASISRGASITDEWGMIKIPLGTFAGVFVPHITFRTFFELNAEFCGKLEMLRSDKTHFEYIKTFGKEPIVLQRKMSGDKSNDIAKLDVTCNGDLYTGVSGILSFDILKEHAGARLKLKIGPAFHSEFGLGLLRELSYSYKPEAYGKATLTTCLRRNVEGTIYTRKLFEDEENERSIFSVNHDYLTRNIDLLPKFMKTNAVKVNLGKLNTVEVATQTENETLNHGNKNIGFELLDKDEKTIDSCFVEPMDSMSTIKGFVAKFDLKNYRDEVISRPIVHYAGHTVKAQYASMMSDVQMQPIVFAMSNSNMSCISGIPFCGSANDGTTLYTAGPFLPVNIPDTVYVKKKEIEPYIYLDDSQQDILYGSWTDIEENITYTFGEEMQGSVESSTYSGSMIYLLNYPQSGKVTIYLGNDETIVLSILSISNNKIIYKRDNDNKKLNLIKK